MLKDAVAIIDIGAYALTAVIGENGINGNFAIRAIVKRNHDAFDENRIDERKLYDALSESVRIISSTAKAKLDKIFVGVPSDFLSLINTEQRSFFNRKKKIREKDLRDFLDSCVKGLDTGDYEVISRTGVCYFLDGALRVEDVLGSVTSSLSSYVSVFCARRDFTDAVRKMLATLKIYDVTFIPVPLAEGKLLFSKEERRSTQVLLDVGYLSTSLVVLSGDGALYKEAFPIGGAHITAYLYDKFDVDYDVAERLKRKINLSIHGDAGNYVVLYGEGQYTFSTKETNEVARFVLDQLAENFDKALSKSRVRLPHNVAVSLTGGGISYIRGGAEYLAGRIEMPVSIVSPKTAYMSKPDDSSCLAVLNYALNQKIY